MLFILIILSVIVFSISYYTYRLTFYVSPKNRSSVLEAPEGEQYKHGREIMTRLIEEMKSKPFERVYITSYDGLRLAGRYYHYRDGAPLQIQFHGYRGSAVRDFCGGNKLAMLAGHNALVVEQRAHGESEGNTITFGIKEKYDCLKWIEYANSRFGSDTKVLLYGLSMGASTVLMALQLDLPSNVVGVVADCPFSSPEKIIRKVCNDIKIPDIIGYPFIRLGAKIFGKFTLKNQTVVDSAALSKMPVLVIHGEDDGFVPHEMSEEIYNASPNTVLLEIFPNADHGISFIANGNRYKQIIKSYFDKIQVEYEDFILKII